MAIRKNRGSARGTRSGSPSSDGRPIHGSSGNVGDVIYRTGFGDDPRYRTPDPNSLSGSPQSILNDSGSYFSRTLGDLGTASGDLSDYQQFLQMLAALNNDENGTYPEDLRKQLIQMWLDFMTKQEQRDFDRSALSEQRLYDNPQNQLARLMGAGISRDAAIQLLSGASESPLVGSGADVQASQPETGVTQSATEIIGSFFGGLCSLGSAIGALGNFGVSAATLGTTIAASKAATAGQLLHNTQLAKTLAGIETASTVVGALSSAVDAGVISKDHNFTSTQDMIKTIRDNADKHQPFKSLVDSGALDKISKDVYSLNALNGAYKSWRESRDYNIDRKHIVKMQALEELGRRIDIDKVNSDIQLNSQYYNESIQRVLNDIQRVQNESMLAQGQFALMGEQSESLNIANQVARLDADWYQANIEDINTVRTSELSLQAAEWNAFMNDPEELSKSVKAWLTNVDNARTAIALEAIYYADEYEGAQHSHGGDVIDTGIRKLAVYFHNMFKYSLGEQTTNVEDFGKMAGSAVLLYLLKKR